MIGKHLQFTASSVHTDSAGRYVLVVGKLNTLPVVLVSVYAPNWDDYTFFNTLFSNMPDMSTHSLIIGGDTNCVLSSLDRSAAGKTTLTKSTQFDQTISGNVWCGWCVALCNPTSRAYSFFSSVHKTYSRIDYFFIDNRILHLVRECDYGAIVISDHGPLSMKLCFSDSQSIYRPWRFNTLLLSDENFVCFLRVEIKFFLEVNQTPGLPFSTVWKSLKAY